VNVYWQSSIETYLDSIDLQLVFSRAMQYTPEEIELTITSLKERKNIERFWQIFVNVALKSVGVHVEMELEEEQQQKKKKAKKRQASGGETVLDVEIPSDIEEDIEQLFGGE